MEELKSDIKTLKKNPIDRSNPISKLFFCWLLPFFVKGYKRELIEDDMYQHRKKHDSKMLGDKLEAAWQKEIKRKKDPSLLKALLKVFYMECLLFYVVAFVVEGARLIQPIVLYKLLQLYDTNQVVEKRYDAYQYSAIIILLNTFNAFGIHYFNLNIMQVGMKMRVACCSLVYRKSLKLSKSALADTTVGQMVNLISNDVSRFDMAATFLHHLVLGPVQIVVAMFLLYENVGWTGLVGAIFLIMSMPLQSYLARKTSQYRLCTAIRTDERVRLMNEIISGIQVIKMYTWEKPFALLVRNARIKEMKYIKYTSTIRAILMSCGMVLNRTAIFLCILVYVLTGNVLTASYAYTTASFYRLLNSATMFFPVAVTQFSEMLISVKRIKTFLNYDEVSLDKTYIEAGFGSFLKEKPTETKLARVPSVNPGIRLKNVSVKWLKSLSENCLEHITLEANASNLFAIVGPVGSGKSTLLHVILQELDPIEGTVDISGTVSYASQEPWLFGGSVRQNILFGLEYDETKYKQVVKACALERDFSLFTHGDRTLVGERGTTLSGGQRARINLARAVYKDADIYLLDDPLSAVDTHVGKQLFDECISGYLKNKCVVLVTHQLQYLKNVDRILLLKDGEIQVSGSYEDLKNADTNFTKLLANIEEEEEENKHKEHEKNNVDNSDGVVQKLSGEEKGTGDIAWHVYKSYILAGGHWWRVLLLTLVFMCSQSLDSTAEYFVSFWVNIQQLAQNSRIASRISAAIDNNSTNGSTLAPVSDSDMLTSDSFEAQRKWWWFIFLSEYTTVYYSIIYCFIITFIFSRSLAFYRWCLTAATRLHHTMFNNIVGSPMKFFNSNPSGRILNRFSRDVGILDEALPMTILDTVQIGLYVLSIVVVIGSLSAWIMIPTLIIMGLFYYLRVVFLESSRDIKRIESVTRSPIYTHLTASLQGLTTIRAFKAQHVLSEEFDCYQNLHSAAFFMFLGANRTFGFWLDFICVVYIALVMVFLLFVKSESFGGNIGLALSQAMAMTGMFQWGMRQWSELVNQMTSVERIQEYADLVPEKDDQTKEPPKSWPDNGNIEFKNVFLRYSQNDSPVLKDLNFTIKSKEKIGIVGRTGAGKTSLIQALFRLADVEGSILIDEVDTKTVSLSKLRSKISIIPQEPVLFSGSLRKNLDPFDEYEDEVLWNALEEVELKSAVKDLPASLENKMAEGGSNFSVGQRQLFCLARAILRNNKILVLDEATANVDPHTDGLIQRTIREKFKDCSVLTIAHRLHTIMDSDKILVMDAGRSIEFDHPHVLLENTFGVFYSLVEQTGRSTAKNLRSMAELSYRNRHGEI